MDFLNKLGKKASEAYQVTKGKASDLSQEIKFKTKIADCEDKIDLLYRDIGEAVYKQVNESGNVSLEEIQGKVDEIKSYFEEIERNKAELLTLKKIKKCVNCGAELEIQADFCSKCGTKQPVVEVKAEVVEENNVENTENNENNENTENSDNNN